MTTTIPDTTGRRKTANDAALSAISAARAAAAALDPAASVADRDEFDTLLVTLELEADEVTKKVAAFAAAKRSRQDPVDLLARAHALREMAQTMFDKAVVAATDSGVTLTQMADLFGGVSRQRAGQILAAAKDRLG